jgi:hypothetical protein
MSSDDTLRLFVAVPQDDGTRGGLEMQVAESIMAAFGLDTHTRVGVPTTFHPPGSGRVCAVVHVSSEVHLPAFHLAIDEWYWSVMDLDCLVDACTSVCRGVGARIARTFGEGGHNLLRAEEHGGNISAVDWFQYFHADLARRWHGVSLSQACIGRAQWGEQGDLTLVLRGSPKEYDLLTEQEALEALGVSLKENRSL